MQKFQAKHDELKSVPFTNDVKKQIDALIEEIPDPSTLATAAEKHEGYLIRGKIRLLLPVFSKESETDFNKALKLNQKNPATWVALSEALWRRSSYTEANEALDSALRLDAKFQGALVQKSRVLRSMCNAQTPKDSGDAEEAADQKHAWLDESVKYAKEAVSVNTEDAESWACLGIAILQQTVACGMDLPVMKKALAALNQAAAKSEINPDVYYNRAVIHQCFGHFGAAIQDYMKAYHLDPKGCRGAKGISEDLLALLQKLKTKMVHNAGMGERDFKKNISGKLPAQSQDKTTSCYLDAVMDKNITDPKEVKNVNVKVLDLVGSPNAQPVTYLCIDKKSNFCLLLLYRTNSAAIKIYDTVEIPFPPSSGATLAHNLPKIEGLEGSDTAFAVPTVVVEPGTIKVNNAPIPTIYCEMPKMKTRLFQ